MRQKNGLVSVSVDDGDLLDLKLADIFEKNNIKATFFIPIKRAGHKVLSKAQIRELSRLFEIGGHTLNHVDLTKVSFDEAEHELIHGKKALEDIIGKRVNSFAFPYGHYNNELVKLVAEAGYKSCRSGRIINFKPFNQEEFLQHPNLHIYPHNLTTSLLHCLKNRDLYSFSKRLSLTQLEHLELIRVISRLKPIHLWCHSQDIEKYDLWSYFDNLKSVGG